MSGCGLCLVLHIWSPVADLQRPHGSLQHQNLVMRAESSLGAFCKASQQSWKTALMRGLTSHIKIVFTKIVCFFAIDDTDSGRARRPVPTTMHRDT